jgi:ankyrin repeat protein
MNKFYDAYKYLNQLGINKCFADACKNGNLEEAKYLLLSKEIKHNADIHYGEDFGFRDACYEGHFHIVQYLLTSPELKELADIHAQGDLGLILACEKGRFDIVKYLLTSTELKENSNINPLGGGTPLGWACSSNHLDIVKYLLTSPELKEHANLHAEEDEPFKWACRKQHLEIIQYFIFDLDIPITQHIDNYLKESPNEKVENMFKLRDLNKSLKNELNISESKIKKSKI